jgi:hypothetical protein
MLDVVGIFRCFQKIGDVIGIQADERLITQLFEEFNPVYPERPVADNNGGIGPNPSTWLFFTATRLNPKLIIESRGGWGHSSWLLRRACHEAKIHAFDLDPSHLTKRGKSITYHEKEWDSHHFKDVNPYRSFLFFHDHVIPCQRIRESFEKDSIFCRLMAICRQEKWLRLDCPFHD